MLELYFHVQAFSDLRVEFLHVFQVVYMCTCTCMNNKIKIKKIKIKKFEYIVTTLIKYKGQLQVR